MIKNNYKMEKIKRKLSINYQEQNKSIKLMANEFLIELKPIILDGNINRIKKYLSDNLDKLCVCINQKHIFSTSILTRLFNFIAESDNFNNYIVIKDFLHVNINIMNISFEYISPKFAIKLKGTLNNGDEVNEFYSRYLMYLIDVGSNDFEYVWKKVSRYQFRLYFNLIGKIIEKDAINALILVIGTDNFSYNTSTEMLLMTYLLNSIIYNSNKCYNFIINNPEKIKKMEYIKISNFPILDYCATLNQQIYYSKCLAILYFKSENCQIITPIKYTNWKMVYLDYLSYKINPNPEIIKDLYQKSSSCNIEILIPPNKYLFSTFLYILEINSTELIPLYKNFIQENTNWNIPTSIIIETLPFLEILKIKDLFTILYKHLICNDDDIIYLSKYLKTEQMSYLGVNMLDDEIIPTIDAEIYINLYKKIILDYKIDIIPDLNNLIRSYL